MEMKDALARSFNATCIYTDGKRHWAEPLPSNAVRDTFGRSIHYPPLSCMKGEYCRIPPDRSGSVG